MLLQSTRLASKSFGKCTHFTAYVACEYALPPCFSLGSLESNMSVVFLTFL